MGVGVLLLAVVQGRDWGWMSPATLISCLIGVVFFLAFVVRSRIHPEPLFDLKLFRLRSYTVANIGSVFFLVAFFSWLIVLPEYLQRVWGWSVLKSGFAIAPGPLLSSALSVTNGRLAGRIGHRPILMVGGIFGVFACLLHLAFTGTTPNFLGGLLFANLVMGAAAGCSFSMLVGASMRDVQPARFGMAGAGRDYRFPVVHCGWCSRRDRCSRTSRRSNRGLEQYAHRLVDCPSYVRVPSSAVRRCLPQRTLEPSDARTASHDLSPLADCLSG